MVVFRLILRLLLVFPILFALMRKLGAGWFLLLCAVETIVSRYLVIYVLKTSGYYLLARFSAAGSGNSRSGW